MDLSQYKNIEIGGVSMKKLLLDGTQIWKKPYVNWFRQSINADGSIYNGGLGYKRGYRVRSGGAEQATTYTSCSGYIPVSPGDVVRISNCQFDYESNSNAINVSDASFTNIGQFTMLPAHYGIFLESGNDAYVSTSVIQEKEGVWKWIVPPEDLGIAYIRLTVYDQVSGSPYEMIATVNEEID